MENQSNPRQLYAAFGPGHPLHGLHAKLDQKTKPRTKLQKKLKQKTEKSSRLPKAKRYSLWLVAVPVIAYLGYKAVVAALQLL